MSADHTTAIDRLSQFRDSTTSSAMDRIANAERSDAAARGMLLAGSRVLDRVTGREGVVCDRTAAVSVPYGQYPVQLDHAEVVVRWPKDLLARPTPPRV